MPQPWGIEPTTLESYPLALCFYRYTLQPAQGFLHGLSYDFGINFPNIIYWTVKRRFVRIFFPSGIQTLAPLISTVNDLRRRDHCLKVFAGSNLKQTKVRSLNHHSYGNKRPSSPHTIHCSCPPIAGL